MPKAIQTMVSALMLASLGRTDTFLIRGARVFDGEQMVGMRDVLIESGNILRIAPKLDPPKGALIINAPGATLLPGLFDSHAHTSDGGYTLTVAGLFGISTVIDLFTASPGNTPREIRERVHRVKPGESADFLSAGICVTPKGGHGTEFGLTIPTLDDPAGAQRFIDARIAEGSDLIKVIYEDFGGEMPRLPKATMAAAISAARDGANWRWFMQARGRMQSEIP